MSADNIEPVCIADIVRPISEAYLNDTYEKFKKSRIQTASKVPKPIPLQLALSLSCICKS